MTKEGINIAHNGLFCTRASLYGVVSTGLSNVLGFLLETSALKEPRR